MAKRRKRNRGSQRRLRLARQHGYTGPLTHAENGKRIPIIVDGEQVGTVVRIGSDLGIDLMGADQKTATGAIMREAEGLQPAASLNPPSYKEHRHV